MGWHKTGDGVIHCTDCDSSFAIGMSCQCLSSSASDPVAPVPSHTHTGAAGFRWFLKADEQWMSEKLDPAAEHLFSRAGRMIALGNVFLELGRATDSIDIKRADSQIKAINAIEKLDSARAIEQRMDAIETALADMAALMASNQGSASRLDMETPQADPASGITDQGN